MNKVDAHSTQFLFIKKKKVTVNQQQTRRKRRRKEQITNMDKVDTHSTQLLFIIFSSAGMLAALKVYMPHCMSVCLFVSVPQLKP